MKPLRNNVIIKKEVPEYSGVLVSVSSDESAYGRVLGIGNEVTLVQLNEKVVVNWREVKHVGGNAYMIEEDKILAILE